jgi:hypothetical protein
VSKGKTCTKGYDTTHKLLRKQWAKQVAAGEVKCWRCREFIEPGEPWDLGHDDHDRTVYRGPEHSLVRYERRALTCVAVVLSAARAAAESGAVPGALPNPLVVQVQAAQERLAGNERGVGHGDLRAGYGLSQ